MEKPITKLAIYLVTYIDIHILLYKLKSTLCDHLILMPYGNLMSILYGNSIYDDLVYQLRI